MRDEVMVLRSSRRRPLVLLLVGAVFVSQGIRMIVAGDPAGWPVTVFFGLSVAAIAALVVRPSTLILTNDGFHMQALGRRWYVPWRDCGAFSTWRMTPLKTLVVFECDSPRVRRHRRLAAFNRAMTGGSSSLPDTYGMSAADLAHLLNERRRRALSPE